jgi:hypothetical protein
MTVLVAIYVTSAKLAQHETSQDLAASIAPLLLGCAHLFHKLSTLMQLDVVFVGYTQEFCAV